MKTEEKSVNTKKLIPFWVIERALEGDIQAINKILKHYEGYICELCKKVTLNPLHRINTRVSWMVLV